MGCVVKLFVCLTSSSAVVLNKRLSVSCHFLFGFAAPELEKPLPLLKLISTARETRAADMDCETTTAELKKKPSLFIPAAKTRSRDLDVDQLKLKGPSSKRKTCRTDYYISLLYKLLNRDVKLKTGGPNVALSFIPSGP